MASVSLKHIYKIYPGGVRAVSDFNLEIQDKEFIVFVGPSGCGKSTTLRMVAGLEEISSGDLYIDGTKVNDVEPKDRDIAMVFQNYALYPHMTVYENMAFGLRLRKIDSREIDFRVKEAAQVLGITELLTRKPKALSGGQRQRVALGRAIVREPKVFLLDEPLSNLDAKLRVQMRTEITKLHNRLATTFIYVTHDQTEAMTMGTRIVVMKDGVIQQADTPQCLYDNPENLFVASFLGSPQMNFFKAKLIKEGENLYAEFGEDAQDGEDENGRGEKDASNNVLSEVNKILIPKSKAKRIIDDSFIGKDVILGVRPEDIHNEQMFIEASPCTVINAEIDVIEKLGNETILYMKVNGKEEYSVARIDARSEIVAGEKMKLAIDANHIHFFDPETELTLMGVPKINVISGKLLAQIDRLSVRFGNYKIDLNAEQEARLYDRSVINGDVNIGISPDDFSLEASDGAIAFDCDVDFTESYPNYTAAYMNIAGKKGFVVAKLPFESTVSGGDKIKLFFDTSKLKLFNKDSGEKILTVMPVSDNTAGVKVEVKDNVATATIGGKKILFTTTYEVRQSGAYDNFRIDPKAISFGKENIAKQPKCVLLGDVVAAEIIGDSTLVYLKVEGFNPYLTAQVSGSVNFNLGEKVKFAVNPTLITASKMPSLKEYVSEKSKETPAYVFVEERKTFRDETAAVSDKTAPQDVATQKASKKSAAKPSKK